MKDKQKKEIRKKRKVMAKVQQRKMRKLNLREDKRKGLEYILGKALFEVEHALSLYATSFFHLPARMIYDTDVLREYEEISKNCHIYIIGYLPKTTLISAYQDGNNAVLKYKIGVENHDLILSLPSGCDLVTDDICPYTVNANGDRFDIPEKASHLFLQQHSRFEVKYVGQAYGKDGSRNALDRLVKHETLQKISLSGVPKDKELHLLLLEVEPNTQLITLLNPFAQNKDESDSRINAGIDKLFFTTEPERISLYEAALIRYFYPQFNKEFKDSFPSTRLKVLQDCYEKDFTMLIAEISFDALPFQLCSEVVDARYSHMAKHNLHEDIQRKAFFYDVI